MGTTKYAYSLKTERVREKDFPYDGKQVTCTTELLDFARCLTRFDTEKFTIVYLNAMNKVIGIHIIDGTVNQATVYPREVFKHALLSSAVAMVLVHNHPSGEVKPSDSDIRLTKIITEIGKQLDILVHDHIIIGIERFFSFREMGIMP